uniref:Uncharacterized protein n=1 Tax=Cuerna arida TaxID=1464854 RepID=A0A1B6GL74_9HEMI
MVGMVDTEDTITVTVVEVMDTAAMVTGVTVTVDTVTVMVEVDTIVTEVTATVTVTTTDRKNSSLSTAVVITPPSLIHNYVPETQHSINQMSASYHPHIVYISTYYYYILLCK